MRAKAGRLVAAALLGAVVARAGPTFARRPPIAPEPAAAAAFANAERALAEGRYDEAERLYRDLVRQMPAVAEVHAKLGVTYYQESKYAEAIPELQRALALKPGAAESRRAARDVTVGGGAARRSPSGSQAGLRAWGGCAVGAARRPSPAAHVHGPRARRGRRGRRLGTDPPVSR